MPGEHVFSGAVPFVATLASTPFVSVIVVSRRRSQGLKVGLKKLLSHLGQPLLAHRRDTPSRCPSARSPICRCLPHSRLDSFEKLCFFLVCVFLAVAVAGFSTVLQLIIRDTVQIACSGGISGPAGRDPGKCPNRNFHLGSTRGDSSITSQRKRITNIARDGEGVRVPRSVALRRRRV